jgi:hypothetical protein
MNESVYLQETKKSKSLIRYNHRNQNQRRRQVKSGLSFDKQTSRDSFSKRLGYETPEGPHYNRFENFKTINTSISKYKDIDSVPPFFKGVSRD